MASTPIIYKPRINVETDTLDWPSDAISSLDFVCDETQFLPRGVIRYEDRGSRKLSEFRGLSMGTNITFCVTESDISNKYYKTGDASKYSYNLTPLTMADIASTKLNDGDATIEFLCEHPWKMFKDFSSHAYSGKANSEIIRSLVKDASSRGFNFEDINDELFNSSDESGEIPRYKCSEPDLDFIINKLLPYTTINKNPAIFFVDEKNNVHLDTFNNMFQKDPKMMIVMGMEQDITDDNKSLAQSMNGIITGNRLKIEIGDIDPTKFVSIMKPNVTFDDCSALFSYTGTLLPKVAVGKYSSSNTQSGYVPISLQSMATMKATDKKFYRNHMIDDLKAVALNEQSRFNSFFTIEVQTMFCGNMVTTGDNVYLVVPPDTNYTPALNDWMNGKWHVRAVRYEFSRPNNVFITKLTLTRPSFIFNKKTTTLFNYESFYSVGMGIY